MTDTSFFNKNGVPPDEPVRFTVDDHGQLGGLADDDHPQYHNDSRGDARYYTKSQADTLLGDKAPVSHTHTIANVTSLQSSLDSKSNVGHAHDDRYYTESEVDSALAGKSNTGHTHVTSDVSGLQAALDGKASLSHTHATSDIVGFAEAVDDEVAGLLKAGDNITLTYNDALNTLTIASTASGSGDVVGPDSATDSRLAAFDGTTGKLIKDSGYSASSFASSTHTHAFADLTSKPTTVSGFGITDAYTKTEVDTALSGKSDTTHTHTFASLTSKPTTISGYGITDAYTKTEVDTALSGKSDTTHTHTFASLTSKPTTLSGYGITDAVSTSRLVSTGTGLSGGGDLSADRTISLANTTVTAGSYTNANITVDAQGRLTAASNGSSGLTIGSTATSGGAAGQIMFDTGSVLQESSSLVWDDTNKYLQVKSDTGRIQLGASSDVILTRRAAANLRFGAADAAAPVAQTLSVQSVVAGTSNTAGANLTITGSQGTGTGAGGSIIFQVAPAGTSGTAQNALATVLTLSGTGAITLGKQGNSGVSTAVQVFSSSFGSNYTWNFYSNGGIYGALQFQGNNEIIFGGQVTIFPRGIGFNNNVYTGPDTFLTRRAAANLRFGYVDAAAPIAQTLSVQSVVAGTSNTAGADLTITGSQGTGTGAGGDIIFQTAAAGSSGTAQNSLMTALRIYSNQTVAVGKAYTVSTLPTAGTQGRRAWVTDATSPTFLGTLTGGGSVVTPVFDNGTAWVAG